MSPKAASPFRRFKYLLFPKFQLTLLVANLMSFFMTAGLVWFYMSSAISDLKIFGGGHGPVAEYYRKYLEYQSDQMAFALALSLGLGVILCTATTLILSHKFVGPLINLRHFFQALRSGKSPRPVLKFRRGDFLEDFPSLINEAVQKVSEDGLQAKPSKEAA